MPAKVSLGRALEVHSCAVAGPAGASKQPKAKKIRRKQQSGRGLDLIRTSGTLQGGTWRTS